MQLMQKEILKEEIDLLDEEIQQMQKNFFYFEQKIIEKKKRLEDKKSLLGLKMKKYIVIKSDYNDGTSIERITEISDEEIEEISPELELLKKDMEEYHLEYSKGSNKNDYPNSDNIDYLHYFLPFADYNDICRIISIEILTCVNEETILNIFNK